MAETKASPSELGALAQSFTTIGKDLRKALSEAREGITLPAGAFGNASYSEAISEQYSWVLEGAGQAVEDLADVADKKSDSVYQVAFAYQETDSGNAGNIEKYRLD